MGKSAFKPGDTVKIYAMPVQETCEIGDAMLVNMVDQGGGLELWNVEFFNKPGKVLPQWIKKPAYDPTYRTRIYERREFDIDTWIQKQLENDR